MDQNLSQKLEEITSTIISRIDPEAKLSIVENQDQIVVNIESKKPALLIGFRGENLQALQLIIGLIFHQQTGVWWTLLVDVDNWQKKRQEELVAAAYRLAQKAKFSNQTQTISHLLPRERRIIHIALADHPDVVTESQGEESDRKLLIKPK